MNRLSTGAMLSMAIMATAVWSQGCGSHTKVTTEAPTRASGSS